MTVVLSKANKALEKELAIYLFKLHCNVYIGVVTRAVFDKLTQSAIALLANTQCEAIMCFENGTAASGYEIMVVGANGIKNNFGLDCIFEKKHASRPNI